MEKSLEGFSLGENPEKAWNTQETDDYSNSYTDSLFSKIGKEKLDALKNTIFEINTLIDGREGLSNEIFKEGEKIKTEINNFLLETENREPEAQKEKIELRKKKIDISELQLNEKVSCWKDVAILKKELRDRERELLEKEERMKMFGEMSE